MLKDWLWDGFDTKRWRILFYVKLVAASGNEAQRMWLCDPSQTRLNLL
jgi:hypothetical protein